MLRLLRQLPVQLGAFMPVAWFAQGVGVSAHEAARIMRQAGFELTRGYSATLGRQCLGVPDRLCPWEMPS
jgi:hypothetical protein